MRDIYTISIYGKRNLVCFNLVLPVSQWEVELDLWQHSSAIRLQVHWLDGIP